MRVEEVEPVEKPALRCDWSTGCTNGRVRELWWWCPDCKRRFASHIRCDYHQVDDSAERTPICRCETVFSWPPKAQLVDLWDPRSVEAWLAC